MSDPASVPPGPPREYKPKLRGRDIFVGMGIGLLFLVICVPLTIAAGVSLSSVVPGGMGGVLAAGLVLVAYAGMIIRLIVKGRGALAAGIVIGTVLDVALAFLILFSICAFSAGIFR